MESIYMFGKIINGVFIKFKMKQRTKCEVYSRVCGYIRPISQWNEGKVEEFKDRKTFLI